MVDHRQPPKPIFWNVPRGSCRFCGTEIVENDKINRRKHWHSKCAKTWRIMNNPSDAREYVLKRDRKTCQECGEKKMAFEVDHIRPLFEAKGNLDYWKPENLVLLCRPCHVEKTRADMIRFRTEQSADL